MSKNKKILYSILLFNCGFIKNIQAVTVDEHIDTSSARNTDTIFEESEEGCKITYGSSISDEQLAIYNENNNNNNILFNNDNGKFVVTLKLNGENSQNDKIYNYFKLIVR